MRLRLLRVLVANRRLLEMAGLLVRVLEDCWFGDFTSSSETLPGTWDVDVMITS